MINSKIFCYIIKNARCIAHEGIKYFIPASLSLSFSLIFCFEFFIPISIFSRFSLFFFWKMNVTCRADIRGGLIFEKYDSWNRALIYIQEMYRTWTSHLYEMTFIVFVLKFEFCLIRSNVVRTKLEYFPR